MNLIRGQLIESSFATGREQKGQEKPWGQFWPLNIKILVSTSLIAFGHRFQFPVCLWSINVGSQRVATFLGSRHLMHLDLAAAAQINRKSWCMSPLSCPFVWVHSNCRAGQAIAPPKAAAAPDKICGRNTKSQICIQEEKFGSYCACADNALSKLVIT